MKKPAVLLCALLLTLACTLSRALTSATSTPAATATPNFLPTGAPPVTGPDPSYKVAAFYYPWYANPSVDGRWIHWNEPAFSPPKDISSDYYPALGAYSSKDPAVIAQHMAWLRQAGVGVIIVSWWGPGSREDSAVPLILPIAEHYGIRVAFHIEPYSGRTADGLLADVKYLYQKYGSSPAFFYSTASSAYSTGNQPKGMFFVWDVGEQESGKYPVQATYWKPALDAIHALPAGGLVIGCTTDGSWVGDGHFDGLYNYITLHLDQEGSFDWARSLPQEALYIPSVMPGNSAKRIGYPAYTYVPRQDGATYNAQWTAALGEGIQPDMVTITSFNEWHEGTMIEPPALGASNGQGYTYADFGKLPPDGYISLTHDWIAKFLAAPWPVAETWRVRIQLATSSDWTTLGILKGGSWLRPSRVSVSDTATIANIDNGRMNLNQSLQDAKAGKQVQITWDILLSDLQPGQDLVLEIERGNLGKTTLTVFNYLGSSPVQVKSFEWQNITGGRNAYQAVLPTGLLVNTPSP